jgi:cytochrome c556
MVATNAQRLELLSRDVGWIVLQTKEYREYSDQFRRDADRMAAAAKAKNLDAAGLAYVQLTLTCIHCHDHVRAEKQRQ